MTGIPLCEEESELFTTEQEAGWPTHTNTHAQKEHARRELHLVLYAHRSTHAQTQECVHRHVSRNIVHKAAHTQTLV